VRGAAAAGEAETSVEDGRRRGFRLGFGLMLLVAAVLIGLYIGAGWLATAVPALEPFLIGYVGAANAFRAWIDGLLASGVDAMSG
jgi:threonine/homoserine/homoserine lactone efflux protein